MSQRRRFVVVVALASVPVVFIVIWFATRGTDPPPVLPKGPTDSPKEIPKGELPLPDGATWIRKAHPRKIVTTLFSQDGSTIVSATESYHGLGAPAEVAVWHAKNGDKENAFKLEGNARPISGIALSPDGKRLASSSGEKKVRLWNTQTGAELTVLEHGQAVQTMAFSSDGKLASAVGYPEHWEVSTAEIVLWHVETAKVLGQIKYAPETPSDPKLPPLPFQKRQATMAVAFSQDCKTLAALVSLHEDRVAINPPYEIEIWNGPGFEQRRRIAFLLGWTESLALSPDGTLVAVNHKQLLSKTGIRLFHINTEKEPVLFEGEFACLAFSRDSKWLAGASKTTVTIWDLASGKEIRSVPGNGESITSMSFSPDKQQIVTGSASGTIILWKLPSG